MELSIAPNRPSNCITHTTSTIVYTEWPAKHNGKSSNKARACHISHVVDPAAFALFTCGVQATLIRKPLHLCEPGMQ